MGIFDTIYAELVCPFCGRQYRHTPLSWEQAKRECQELKEWELKCAQPPDDPWDELFHHTQAMRARADGYTVREGEYESEDILAWIEQLDSPENIERWRTRKELGLAEIQTKVFDNILGMCTSSVMKSQLIGGTITSKRVSHVRAAEKSMRGNMSKSGSRSRIAGSKRY